MAAVTTTENAEPTATAEVLSVEHIAEGLRGLAVPLSTLQLLPGNPRIGNVDAVAASLKRFGQRKPIVVNRTNAEVEAGNHTLQGARLLGWPTIAAVFVDDDAATAKAYSLADNRTGDLGVYDDDLLLKMIQEVKEFDDALLADTGWGADAIEDLLSSLAAPTLEELARQVQEPPESALWPSVSFKAPPELVQRFNRTVAEQPGATLIQRIEALLDRCES